MAPRREILDSEDEGDDFESVNGETGDALALEADPSGHHDNFNLDTPAGETASHSTGSTDPAFFQRIYEEQQAAASVQETTTHPLRNEASPSSGVITSPGREIEKQPLSTEKSSLTSVTDPVPASRKTRKTKQSNMKEVLDLTQITTPRKGGASGEVDPWELPSSPLPAVDNIESTARSISRVTRSSEKRKRTGQESSPRGVLHAESSELSPSRDVPDPYDFPDPDDMSPVRTSKRKRRDTKSSSARKSRGSEVIQELEEPEFSDKGYEGGHGTANSNGPDSSIPPTLPAMYIAPTSLTDSQKQQYKTVSVSSQHWQESQEPSVPLNGLETNAHKSSGATTVAYPTPSRFRSSIQRGITDDMLPYPVSALDPEGTVAQDQMSSPDELAGSTSSRSKRTRARTSHEAQASSQLESPVLTRSARRLTRHTVFGGQSNPQGHFDDPIILDNTQKTNDYTHDEVAEMIDPDAQLQQSVSLEEAGIDHGPETEPQKHPEEDVVEDPIPLIQEAPPKKKRGRKKKEQIVEEPILEDEASGDHPQPPEEIPTPAVGLVPEETEEPPLKKRRGRPRKSELAKLAVPAQIEPYTEGVDDDFTLESESLVNAGEPKVAKRKANKKATKKIKKQSRDDDLEPEQTDQSPAGAEAEAAGSLTEISHNSRQSGFLSADGEAETREKQHKQPTQPTQPTQLAMKTGSKEKSAALTTKGASTPATPGKVQYRVGLSKRSRIAPLLKSLRK